METNVNYTIVGAFVIFLVAAIVMAIIWLSAGFSVDQYTTYKVYMKEAVTGLSLDAAVEYNGVNVGTVSSIKLNRNNPQLVELLLAIKSNTPITHGTTATLNIKGITGIAYIALKDKGTDMRPLTTQPGRRYPVINTAPSFFLQLDTALTQLNNSFTQISQAIQGLLNPQNQTSIRNILISFDKITAQLAMNSYQVKPFMNESVSAMRILSRETLPAANQALSNLDEVTQNLTKISAELQQNPAILIRGRGPEALGPGEQ